MKISADIHPMELIGKQIRRDGVFLRVHMIRVFKNTIYVHPRGDNFYSDFGYTFWSDSQRGPLTDWEFVPEDEQYGA